MMQVLFKDANTQLDINGVFTEPFSLGRSIRKGCPLAPALFAIASKELHYILKSDRIKPKLNGINLPNGSPLINIQFANDTALFPILKEENIKNVVNRLDLFYKAFGSKVSQTKSNLLSWNDNPPKWTSNYGWQWGRPDKVVRYLEIPFSISPSS